MRASDQWLKANAGRVRRPLFIAVLLGLGAGVLIILQTAAVVRIVDTAIFDNQTLATLRTPFLLTLLIIFARAATQYASGRMGYYCAARVRQSVRADLLARLRELGPVRLSREHSGELAGTVTDGVEALEPYFSRYLPQRAVAAILPLLILAVSYPTDWITGLIFTGTAVFIPVLMILIGEEARSRNQRQWKELSRMNSRFLDILRGLPTLKMFGAARREGEVIRKISEDHRAATMEVVRIAFVSSLMLELITTISIALVAITTGLRLLHGTMDFSRAYFVLLIAPEFYQPLRTMGTTYHARMSAAAAAERIYALLAPDAPPAEPHADVPAAPPTAAPTGPTTGASAARPAAVAADGTAGTATAPAPPEIEFQNVTCAYDQARRGPVLHDISLRVGPGEHVAVTGKSGIGKTTLLYLLLGFLQPQEGSVLVNGVNAATLDTERWRTHVAWMPQRPTIFPATVRENIALGRPGASEAEVEAAAQRAHAHHFISRLPRGFDTAVGDGGHGLSGGEVQRLGLARLFLRDARLLLLDEPATHLDAESEQYVHSAIRDLAAGRTMIVVAHRAAALDLVERVIAL